MCFKPAHRAGHCAHAFHRGIPPVATPLCFSKPVCKLPLLPSRISSTLPSDQQLALHWAHGRYLARRWGKGPVALYTLLGFFREVHRAANALLRTHGCLGTAGPEGYIAGIARVICRDQYRASRTVTRRLG